MQRRFFADQTILADGFRVGQIDARTDRATVWTRVPFELAGRMSGAQFAVFGQLAARIGHVPVRMIILVG